MPKTATPLITWSRTFPALPEQVREARRFLAAVLASRDAPDALLCLSELVTNAVVHSHSTQPGGTFTVRARLMARACGWKLATRAAPGTHPAKPARTSRTAGDY